MKFTSSAEGFTHNRMEQRTRGYVDRPLRAWNILPIILLLGCAAKKPVAPAPQIRVVQVHSQLKGCSISGNVATCEFSPVSTKIDSKTGKTTVMCKFHVENPQ